jgi:chitodextrinase
MTPKRRLGVALAGAAVLITLAGSSTLTAAPAGLVAAYAFDEAAGSTVVDASGNGNTGTISGAARVVGGKYGGALSFDGVDDLVTVADAASLDLTGGMTLEAWVRPSSLGSSWRTAVLKERPGGLAYALYPHTGGRGPSGHVFVGSSEPRARLGTALTANAWSHVAATYDGARIRLYVNGVERASHMATGSIATSPSPLRLGGNTVWTEWFAGLLDDVRVYNRALSAAEIQTDLATPVGGSPPSGDTQPPSQPSGLTTTWRTTTSVSVRWNASSDNIGVTGYRLFLDGAPAGTTTSTSTTFSRLGCGRTYSVGVEAYDGAGNRSTRATLNTSTSACRSTDTQPPTNPTAFARTSSTVSSISVSWSASSDNVGVAGYGLYRNGASVASTGALTYTFSGLACGTSYTLAVDAYDAAGNRSGHAALTAATSTCPPAGAVPVYTKDNPPRTPTVDELPRQSSVSMDGITWTFSEAVPVGRFITGDYYVVGPVTVTAISPAPANGRHGSVKNLPPVDDKTGFDSRTEGNRYDASLRVSLPVSLAPGDSLVSSISVDTVGATQRWLFNTSADSPVKSVSILTSLSAPQPPDAFRPSYVGKGAPIFYSRNLRRDLLPKLAPVSSTPSLAEYQSHFRRPWIDNLFFSFDTPIEYMPDYAREIARAVGMAGLLLSLNYTAEQKEPLLVYLTQYGIDLYGLVQRGHPGWPAHGGHGSGRKLPILLAGTLLEQTVITQASTRFGEDMQTMMGTGWTGATALYAGHYGKNGTGQYGPYEHLQPRDWPSTLGEDYRRCCTSSAWIGEALVARLVPGVMAAWNYSPFFAYADRWMTEDDTQARATIRSQIGKNYDSFPQRKAWDAFVTNMWSAYR